MVTRESCERELSLALSRYVGYTTGAYHIVERLDDITTRFDKKPFLYEVELIKVLRDKFQISSKYAIGITNFTQSLGFIRRIERGGQIARFYLTPVGRTYRAALSLNEEKFKQFLFSYAVFEYDCDVYGLLLDMADENGLESGAKLHLEFLRRTIELRKIRLKWLEKTFPNRILRERIERYILWIEDPKREEPSEDFARHHATPRKGWAQSLGHLSKSGILTDEGRRLLNRLKGDQKDYFWLAPRKECFNKLNVLIPDFSGEFAPAWNLLRPQQSDEEPNEQCVERVVQFMEEAYYYIRLIQSNQADLDSVVPYLYFVEHLIGRRVDENILFMKIFSKYRDKFAPMSKRTSLLGHYQLRRKL